MSTSPSAAADSSAAQSRPRNQSGPRRSDLARSLSDLTLRDESRLGRRLDKARTPDALTAIAAEIERAQSAVQVRRASVPPITYPESLPVTARREDIAAAIDKHQVVIVAGETGSGKTTQIPKICLELGRGVRGLIGHTQPRRLAARTVAERIAEELDRPLGETIGYTVRFTDHVSDKTLVKVMTDGILLNEIQRDRMLWRYDTLIIDEAHERSLNIDFILGYLKQLLPRRPDLKVIITSATIDPQRFAEHFGVNGVPAPIIEVSGRTFPVEMRYRPLTVQQGEQTIDRDPLDAICEAATELLKAGDGDILVFLSGEREIRDAADALRERNFRNTEILSLYARLSAADQHKVFRGHAGRRIVLSTNVAETSLTVPGIRYVIDTGLARISRYSVRTKVQRLPIEDISQASANQRSGRCGRVADGICIRLYSEEDYDSRPAFTEPEILRTNLASVILQMTALGLGDIAAFPFVEPPDSRAVRDGVSLLQELGAIVAATKPGEVNTLTDNGKALARLPVDPRMGRMLLEAHRQGCLREMLVIVSAVSMQDVRERPAEHQQAADQQHARFNVAGSDFLAYLRLWEYLGEQRHALSSSQFRKMCRTEFLHWMRIREWQDLHGQLKQITRELNWDRNTVDASEDAIHQSLLSGLLSHIGLREGDKKDFLGARGARFAVFPGSSLFKKPPRWIMAGELVETSRLWARSVAQIQPEWAETLAPHLVKSSYSEPHWSSKRAAAMAYEKVTLYGVPLVARRLVPYGQIDQEASRDLFIRHALVQGEWQTNHDFFHHNRALLESMEELEHRARRRDIVVEDDDLFDFYDKRVGESVVSARHFDSWWKKARKADPDLLSFQQQTVTNDDANRVNSADYPDAWQQGQLRFPLTYHFEPGHPDDGVTARIPIELLAQIQPVGFDWLVPGLRLDLATAMIKSLPKPARRTVVPAPDFAAAAMASIKPRTEPLNTALARELSRLGNCAISPREFVPDALPPHLRMGFIATGADGHELGRSKDLAALKHSLAKQIRAASAAQGLDAARPATLEWTSETLGAIPDQVTRTVGGQKVIGYPTLAVEPQKASASGKASKAGAAPAAPIAAAVGVRVVATQAEQRQLMRAGTRQLLLNALPGPPKMLISDFDNRYRLLLSQYPFGGLSGLLAEAHECAIDELMGMGPAVRDAAAFEALRKSVAADLYPRTSAILRSAAQVVEQWAQVQRLLPAADPATADDVRDQVADLVHQGFLLETGAARVAHLPRYLAAAAQRLEAAPKGLAPAAMARENSGMHTLNRVYGALQHYLDTCPPAKASSPQVLDVYWLIEELRVGLFAQRLGTAQPVSEKRIIKAIAALG
ncbi:ATP-dependent RNA helicase HrpA [Tomitella biformata]|uniref:ATP-dependent RNA helicase HrpA n=1 Tax=Tomitella biformata TaxID=630403 RepID=UPI00046461A2|nr:ATP-dependent RNA helicase HrpA [Tomitella biformata]